MSSRDQKSPDHTSVSTDAYVHPLSRFVDNLDRFIADGIKDDVLRPHQRRVFDDVSRFLREGGTRGFIEMPTGTGKTVLFVSMAEAFSYNDPNPPRILVVTPTRDLVRQTEGGPLNQKGFAGFAPAMNVGTFYSDTRRSEREAEPQVTITTYASLRRLANTYVSQVTDGLRSSSILNRVNENYDIIFFDEGHRAQGVGTREIIESLDSDKMLIGFTATPDYNAERKLESILPVLIHKLDIEESIEMHMLSPVLPLAVRAPSATEYTFSAGPGYDYEKQSLKALIYDTRRNEMIVDMASQAVRQGNSPIVSCIPGDDMTHPQLIADALSRQLTTDSDGKTIPIKAVAITSKMSSKARQTIYQELEAGQVHALAYIDVLNEGWDSQTANVLINARPTRSLLSARQRVGRILRPKTEGRPALAIDIIDSVSSQTTPPATIADVLKRETLQSGEAVGEVSAAFAGPMADLLEQLTQKYERIKTLTNEHTRFMEEIAQLPLAKRGIVKIEQGGQVTTYATLRRLYEKLNVDTFFLDKLKQQDITPHMARVGAQPEETFQESVVHDALVELPSAPASGRYFVEGASEFMSVEDIVAILRSRYKASSIEPRDVLLELKRSAVSVDELRFGKYQWARTHTGRKLYKQRLFIPKLIAHDLISRLHVEL